MAASTLTTTTFAQSSPNGSQPSPTPLVKPIVSSRAVNAPPPQRQTLVTVPNLSTPGRTQSPSSNSTMSSMPVSPDIAQPSLEPFVNGYRGVLVETQRGQLVMDSSSNTPFNPASNVKLITGLAVLKTLKANYRFQTKVYTDGVFDPATGVVEGNLVVLGNDPSLNYEHAIAVAAGLNKIGIRQINGDLIVSPSFVMNYSPASLRSGVVFYDTMDATRRSTTAYTAWQRYLSATQKKGVPQSIPSVAITGAVTTSEIPSNLRLLLTHESSPLTDILKVCLSYSNNFLAERLGDAVGGSQAVASIAQQTAQVPFEELQLASSSGLGINRVTPRAMMKVFRALQMELAKNKILPTDIMPVAGVDEGTLKRRFTDYRSRASFIGKTGTLPNTDGGVSSLVGQAATASGEILYFVIFNQRGGASRFRDYQNELVTYLQNQRGGAASFQYLPKYFPTLLSGDRVNIEKSFAATVKTN
ncbi:MAG: D-alanyl-D-alanine carboxypeptidase [Pyrinomonadaceae bacterium]|nr:D-alanyl-D-alanine carboxypeptidase [Pyrinomonadaceae bacterium]